MPLALLCHFDGTSGQTTFADTGGGHPLTATSVTVSTASPKFGTGSGDFTAGVGARIDTGSWIDFCLGSGPFTIEAWTYLTSTPSVSRYGTIATQWNNNIGSNLGWQFGFYPNLSFFLSTDGGNNIQTQGGSVPSLNVWHHIAVDRDTGGILRLYVDGVVQTSVLRPETIYPSTLTCLIGNDHFNQQGFLGRLDEVRIVVGAAMFGGAFTPPTAPYADVSSPPTTAIVTNVALEFWGPRVFASGAGEADAAATVTGLGIASTFIHAAGEADAAADVRGTGFTAILAGGTGEADAAADVSGVGFSISIGGSLPVFPGLGWSVHRRPTFDTVVAQHTSGDDVRMARWQYALWEFELTYDGLSSASDDNSNAGQYPGLGDSSLQTLMGFYLFAGGARGRFLYIDPDFNTLVNQAIGSGDGFTTQFPFYRPVGRTAFEQISAVTNVANVWIGSTSNPPISGWSMVNAVLLLPFAPASGDNVIVTFSYGFVCRFMDDSLDFEQFMDNLWQLKSLKFRQVRL